MPTKLQAAHAIAAKVSELSGGQLLLGLSGKDSFATLALCAEHFQRIVCFHMYHVRGLECEEAPLRAICKRYGAKPLYAPHPDMYRMLKHAVCRVHLAKLDHTPTLKLSDIERSMRKRTGIDWIAYGERLSDSFARRLFWRHHGGVYEKGRRCAPIVDWLDMDVLAFSKLHKLPAPCRFGQTTSGTGFDLTRSTLSWLAAKHPADYQRVLRVFPGAAAELLEARA